MKWSYEISEISQKLSEISQKLSEISQKLSKISRNVWNFSKIMGSYRKFRKIFPKIFKKFRGKFSNLRGQFRQIMNWFEMLLKFTRKFPKKIAKNLEWTPVNLRPIVHFRQISLRVWHVLFAKFHNRSASFRIAQIKTFQRIKTHSRNVM